MELLPKYMQKGNAAPRIEAGGVPRVNLLPREVVAKRAQSGAIKSWGLRVAVAVIVVAVGVFGMFAWQAVTALRLAATQAEGMSLLSQIGAKAEIQQLVQTESNLGAFEKNALATDFGWAESMQKLLAKFPEGASLCSFDLAGGAAPSGEPEAQVGLSGVFTICGSFASAIPYLRDATSVDGVLAVTIVESKYDQTLSMYTHAIAVQFDQTVYVGGTEKKKSEASKPTPPPSPEEEGAEAPSESAENSVDGENQPAATTPATEEAAA